MARHAQPHRQWQRPEQLPGWPNTWGDSRHVWVDGVPVPGITTGIGFAAFIVLPFAAWAVAAEPADWLAIVAFVLSIVCYWFVVVPWAMRIVDLRRRHQRTTTTPSDEPESPTSR